MTGLMLKDLLYFRRTGKVLIVLVLFYPALFFTMGGTESASGIFSGMIVMMTVFLPMNAFAYDETAKWEFYARSLPVPGNRSVLARYLLALLFALSLSLFALLINLAALRSVPESTGITLSVSFGIALLLCAFLFPLIYRFGMQKARIAMAAIFLLPSAAVFLTQKFNFSMPGGIDPVFVLRLISLPCFLLFVLSCLISCRIHARKEV